MISIQFLILFNWFLRYNEAVTVKVEVEQGWLEGEVLVPSTGMGKYNSFKSIPYAAPPLGTLRFKAPQPPLKWKGIRNASAHGPVCVQLPLSSDIIGSEDCLFLNVYSPDLDPATPLPVMFFIHGGSWIIGSGNDDKFAPDFLMAHGIVLVTINYRLNAFGFLSADTKDVPGNAGLKDQIAALHWVQQNIRHFGGDPKSVTIFGQSVGGSSVTLHIVSPAAKHLFHRAIAMSGTAFNDKSVEFKHKKRAFILGQKLGINTDDSRELIEYLQNVSPEALIQTQPEILLSDRASHSDFTTIYFTPVVEKKFGTGEGQFLTERPSVLMRNRRVNPVDLLIGHTELEGLFLISNPVVESNIFKYYPNYPQLLVPLKISYIRSPSNVLHLADRIHKFYFGNQSISLQTIKQLVTYYSYSHYIYDIHAFIEKLPKLADTKRFFYGFSIYGSRNVYSKRGAEKFGIRQATHLDDLPYLFDGSSYNLTVDVNKEAFKYVQLMCTLYTNFAKSGTPTPDDSLGLVWPEYDPHKTAVIIGETGNLSATNISYSPSTSIGFWHQLYLSAGINL